MVRTSTFMCVSLEVKLAIVISQALRKIHNRIHGFAIAVEEPCTERGMIIVALEVECDVLGGAGEACTPSSAMSDTPRASLPQERA